MMDPFQNNMATQFGRFRILFRKSFIENVYINILKNIFLCNSFYLIIFLKHLRCVFTNAYGVRICSACGGNSRRHFGRTMCLHTKDTSTGQPTAGRSKLPSAAGVFRKNNNLSFRPCPTEIGLYSHRSRLEARIFGFKIKRDCTICVAKTKALISFAVTAKLVCAFVFAYADC